MVVNLGSEELAFAEIKNLANVVGIRYASKTRKNLSKKVFRSTCGKQEYMADDNTIMATMAQAA